jgi:ABC-type phosphate/phosphonate transport system substrate-binding protein
MQMGANEMLPRILTGLIAFTTIFAVQVAGADERPSPSPASNEQNVVRIGAVAYSPSVVTVFDDLRRYLNRHHFPSDYVLYSNYDALVAALSRREIDIAWNTPLAHAQFHVRNGGASRTLVMRDVDCEVRSVLLARTDSPINSVKDLEGKRLILGSSDAAEATVLPVYYLKKEKVDFERIKVVSLDKEVDFKGNPCRSPAHVLQALEAGRGDVGIITESLWRLAESEQSKSPKLKLIWTSPAFSHCVFTAPKEFDDAKAKRFIELMTAMKPTETDCADIMRLEGTKKWQPGFPEGFDDLIGALRQK